jgi:hypothetical protein
MSREQRRQQVQDARRRLARDGPPWTRDRAGDFDTVTVPEREWSNVGWDLLRSAGLDTIARLVRQPSSLALPQLVSQGLVADAAFVDGSHRFHEVFVDLAFLRQIVRPGGVIVLDDHHWPSVRTAAHYYEVNMGWRVVPGAFDAGTVDPRTGQTRLRALRLPNPPFEPDFDRFQPF